MKYITNRSFVLRFVFLKEELIMKRIVILTGAGMSVESGLGTFRGGGGLWDNYPVEKVATPEGYRANPSLVLEFYNKRRKELLTVGPKRDISLYRRLRSALMLPS